MGTTGVRTRVAPPAPALTAGGAGPLPARGALGRPGVAGGATIAGPAPARTRRRVSVRLGGGLPRSRPLSRTIRLAGHAAGAGAPQLRLVATPVGPRRTLSAPAKLGPQGLLMVAEKAFLRNARAHQYRTFLLNPGPSGSGDDTGRYVYV